MHCRSFPAPTSLLLLSAVLLSGCGMGLQSTGSSSSSELAAVQGRIKGGQQPVTHSSVQFFAASNTGYGTASTPVSPVVMSDASGSFALTSPLTCTGSQQVYVVATGGNPGFDESGGAVNNNALVLMAALGSCSTLNASTNIILNELTTVAATWALAPFMTDYSHIGTSAGNATGLANAFAMANNLVGYASGAAPGNVPAGATVPVTELNTLANILASCVNTKGWTAGDLSPCDNLFTLTTPPTVVVPLAVTPRVTPVSSEPQNAAAAALNIARYPANNAAEIAVLPTPQSPFQPAGYVPNDWTVAISFSVVGARTISGMAFDATGNLWVVAPDALYELSPQGAVLGSFPSMAGNSVAIDATGNIWATTAINALSKMPANLSTPVVYTAANGSSALNDGLAIDGNGNPWYTCDSCSAIYKLDLSKDPSSDVSTFGVTGSIHQTNVSIDTNENAWLGNFDYAKVNVFKNDGTPLPGSPLLCGNCGHPAFVANDIAGNAWIVGNDLTYLVTSTTGVANYESPTGGLFSPSSVAIDGAGNAWIANTVSFLSTEAGSISEFNAATGAITPATGYVSDTLETPQSIAIDGSGSVWVRNTGAATVTAFVGAGTPVVTPLALGVKNNSLGSEPQ